MRKNLFAWVVFTAIALLGFASCDSKPESYNVTFYKASYLGSADYNANSYELSFRVGNVEWDGVSYTNDGTLVHLQLVSPSGTKDMPAAGTYAVVASCDGSANQALAGKLDNSSYTGTFVTTVTNGTPAVEPIVEGTVVVSGTKDAARVELQITDAEGKEVVYVYSGAIACEDLSGEGEEGGEDTGDYQYEPNEVSTFDITCNEVIQFYDLGNDTEVGARRYQLVLYDGNTNRVWIEFYANPDGTMPVGEYPLSKTWKEGAAAASHGFENGFDTGCFVNTDFVKSTNYFKISYYLVSGKLVVKENSVSLNAKSKKGSTFKVAYSGELSVVDMSGK